MHVLLHDDLSINRNIIAFKYFTISVIFIFDNIKYLAML